jgi:hypothetical protein
VEPNGAHNVLTIDLSSVAVLGQMGWQPFGGMRQEIFSLFGAKAKGKK